MRQILLTAQAAPLQQLDCGCEIGTIDDAFVIRPCSLRCERYRYVIEEGRAQDKPIGFGFEGDPC